MRIQIEFDSSKIIDIRLFEEQSIKNWFERFYHHTDSYFMSYEHIPECLRPNIDTEKEWNEIRSALNDIKDIGYRVPDRFNLPDEFNHDQSLLNDLHRFFTYNVLWLQDFYSDQTIKNPYDPDFVVSARWSNDWDGWHLLFDRINRAVHQLESHTIPHEHTAFVKEILGDDVSLGFHKEVSLIHSEMVREFFDFEQQKQNYRYFDYDHPQLVTLNRSILGKCVLQSFLEGDDPTARDCTGRTMSYGGFIVESSSDKKKEIYRSSKFQNWLASYGLSGIELPYEFPIGYVEKSDINISDCNRWKRNLTRVSFLR